MKDESLIVLYSAELDALVVLEWGVTHWHLTFETEYMPSWNRRTPDTYDWTLVGEL